MTNGHVDILMDHAYGHGRARDVQPLGLRQPTRDINV